MTDDQELIAEAVARVVELRAGYPLEMGPLGGDHGLIEELTTALSAAAVRYRAEGWDEGYDQGWRDNETEQDSADNPYRALLDENNETQEG